MDTKQCSVRIYSEGYSVTGGHFCTKPVVVERDGKPYCKIHDPEYIKAKERKWQEKFDRQYAEDQDKFARRKAMADACNRLTTEELRQLNPNLCKAAPKLLEALKGLALAYSVDGESIILNQDPEYWQQAIKAIAKAGG